MASRVGLYGFAVGFMELQQRQVEERHRTAVQNAVAAAMDTQQATVNAAAPTLTREQMVNMLKAATGAEPEGDDNALREKLNAILSAGVRAMAR